MMLVRHTACRAAGDITSEDLAALAFVDHSERANRPAATNARSVLADRSLKAPRSLQARRPFVVSIVRRTLG
jgi:hypothetical protein